MAPNKKNSYPREKSMVILAPLTVSILSWLAYSNVYKGKLNFKIVRENGDSDCVPCPSLAPEFVSGKMSELVDSFLCLSLSPHTPGKCAVLSRGMWISGAISGQENNIDMSSKMLFLVFPTLSCPPSFLGLDLWLVYICFNRHVQKMIIFSFLIMPKSFLLTLSSLEMFSSVKESHFCWI